jgi:hypothetical protein
MNQPSVVVIATALLGALCLPAAAQEKPGPNTEVIGESAPGKAVLARRTKATATVELIDLAQRHVILKGPSGKVIPLTVGPEVRNLDKIKVGDRVAVEYLEALSLTLKKDGKELRGRKDTESGVRSAPGESPGAAVAQQIDVTAEVIAVNPKNQTLTLRGPKQVVDLMVRDPEQFKLVKVGDHIQAVYTEALALALEPASPNKK